MSTYFDFSTYVYSNLLNSKNVSQQFATAIANCAAKFYCGSLDPISRAGTILKIPKLLITIIIQYFETYHIKTLSAEIDVGLKASKELILFK